MTEHLVSDWLEDYAALEQSQLRSFASEQEHNHEIVIAVYNVLEEKNKYSDLIDPVCNQLFAFYRSQEVELQRFTLQFVPVLIRVYLMSVARGDKRSCRSVEALLIGIYNLEVVDQAGQPRAVSFRMPSIAQASIYHEPMSLAPSFLTENALRRLEECNTKLVSWGPLPQVEALNAQNRLKVMTALLFVYNQQLSQLPKNGLEHLCKVATKLVTQGFNKPGHFQRSSHGSDSSGGYVPLRPAPRIPVSSQLLLELLHAAYFASFNGHEMSATRAVADIHQRACYESYADVQLLANAIQHSLHIAHRGHPSDRPMGISVAMSPATTTVSMTKSMITNASFRTKKLPDDIPIQDKDDGGESKNLVSISEEREDELATSDKAKVRSTKEICAPKGVAKLHNILKLNKDKDVKSSSKNGMTNAPETSDVSKKITPTTPKENAKNTARNSLHGSTINGDSAGIEYIPLTRKNVANEPPNGPLTLESKNGTELEKVSLVSDSLQTSGDVSDGQSILTTDSLDSSIDTDNGPLIRDKENVLSMQVSSV